MRLKDFLIGVGITITLLLVAELGVGLTFGVRTDLVIDHPIFHHVWKPNQTFLSYCPGDETPSPPLRTVNALSWLDGPVLSKEKEPNEFRVLFVGDSFVQGSGSAKASMPGVVVRLLQKQLPYRKVTHINSGTLSYSPLLISVRLANLLQYHPDLVIFSVDMTDDFDDWKYRQTIVANPAGSILAVQPRSLLFAPFREGRNGIERSSFFKNAPLWLAKRSELAFFLFSLFAQDSGSPSPNEVFQKNYLELHEKGIYTRWAWCRNEWDEFTTENVRFTLSQIDQVVRAVRALGIPLVATAVPHIHQLQGVWSERPHLLIQEQVLASGGLYADTLSKLRALGEESESLYCKGDMHFNSRGNERWGTAIAESLIPLLPLERPQGVP
ncbi:MAG: SGNH/GDSL hydrolase family protein [Bdellovibrionales bacterium]|nr:SGNH/GDSL hydrolase family protein [Bdellovibrionales bacterium]